MKFTHFSTLWIALCAVPAVFTARHGGSPQTPVRPPSFQRTPTTFECADGSTRPLNVSALDLAALRALHPRCPLAALEFREAPPQCPDISFCPREFRAISPCGDCCFVCREPNEEFMAAATARNASAKNDPCVGFKCKRLQRCVKNIQGLPVCRCFPVEMCSKPAPLKGKKKDKRGKEICGNDGNSYESRCHLQVAACQTHTHIRMVHKGACMKPAATTIPETDKVKAKRPNNRRQNKQTANHRGHHPTTEQPRAGKRQGTQSASGGVAGVGAARRPSKKNPAAAAWAGKMSPDYVAPGRERERARKGKKGRKGARRERPRVDHSERPRVDHSERPRVERPERPRVERPERPRVERPERPRVERLERPRVERPERPRVDRPERPRVDRPERPRVDRPERPRVDRPERPEWSRMERPERTRMDGPERQKGSGGGGDRPDGPDRSDRSDRSRVDRPERTRITKIERLERKKLKLEKRLMREKERASGRKPKEQRF